MGIKKSVFVTRMFQQDRMGACTVNACHTWDTFHVRGGVCRIPPPALGVRPVTRQSYGNWADDYAGKVGKAFTAFESGRGSCCQYLDMFSWPFTRGWKEIQYPKLGAFGSLYEGRYPKQSNSKCVLTA